MYKFNIFKEINEKLKNISIENGLQKQLRRFAAIQTAAPEIKN